MSEQFQVNRLYSSPSVAIRDVRCRAHRHGCGPEERASAHEIVFLRAGVFAKRVGREEFVADPNQVLFFNRDEPYHVAHPADCGDDCTAFEFEPELVREVAVAFKPRIEERPGRPFEFTHTLSNQILFLLHHRLRQRLVSGANDALTTEELALDLLAAAVRSAYAVRGVRAPRRAETASAYRDHAAATQLLLATRFTEKLGLADIARLVHCSPFHLARLFRAETGVAIHQYRNRLRLRAALERVAAGESNLTQLALDLGFSSHSPFTDAFRAAFGLPPSECRKGATTQRLRELSKNLEVARALAA